MKYYSEKLGKVYDTAELCQKAEFEAKEAENREKIRKERQLAYEKEQKEKAAAERKADAEKVEVARAAMIEAQKNYRDALDEFIKKHKTYHFSSSNIEDFPTLFNFFDKFFL